MTGLRISIALVLLVLVPLRAGAQEVPRPVRTAAACAPVGTAPPSNPPKVSPASGTRMMFTDGEVVAIDRGTDDGLRAGQQYFVRRPMRFHGAPRAEYTIGRLRVTNAKPSTATAQVEFTCDPITVGDHLEPYSELTLSPELTRTFVGGTLDPRRALQVSYGNDGRSLFGDTDFILAQGGEDRGVMPGARYAALPPRSDNDAAPFAEAVVVAVFADQSLLRLTGARDPVFAGDVLALRVGATDPASASLTNAPNPPSGSAPPSRPAPSAAAVTASSADESSSRAPQRSLTFEDVHFALNRAALRPEARALLDEAVKTLQADPTLRVRIEGYTCDLGTAQYNLALGQRRADAVRQYLVTKGVAGERLTTMSYGEENPAYDNLSPETRRLNRRAVLVVSLQR